MERAHPPKNDSPTNLEEYARRQRCGQHDQGARGGSVLEEIARQVAGERRPAHRLARSQPPARHTSETHDSRRDNAPERDRPAADLHTEPLLQVHRIAPARGGRHRPGSAHFRITEDSTAVGFADWEDRSYANAVVSVRLPIVDKVAPGPHHPVCLTHEEPSTGTATGAGTGPGPG